MLESHLRTEHPEGDVATILYGEPRFTDEAGRVRRPIGPMAASTGALGRDPSAVRASVACLYPSARSRSIRSTSPGSGKRPASRFEKTSSWPWRTSKMPLRPRIRVGRTPSSRSSSAARPAARGR